MDISTENANLGLGQSKVNRRSMMPFMVMIDYGIKGMGVAFNREQADSFWRPFYLAASLTPEIAQAAPRPLTTTELEGKRPPDIATWVGTWIVRENVKNVIEELEPGVHAFLQLNAITETSKKDLGVFYAVRIQQVVDAVVVDGTDYREGPGRKGWEKSDYKGISILGTAALDPGKLGNQHLWKEHEGFGAMTFCSDVFQERIKSIKARGWQFKRCRIGTSEDFANCG